MRRMGWSSIMVRVDNWPGSGVHCCYDMVKVCFGSSSPWGTAFVSLSFCNVSWEEWIAGQATPVLS